MLGLACVRVCTFWGAATPPSSTSCQSFWSGNRLYPRNIAIQTPFSPALPKAIHGSSVFARGRSSTLNDGKDSNLHKARFPLTYYRNHAGSCLLAANGIVVATTWHALLPSCHFSSHALDRMSTVELNRGVGAVLGSHSNQAEWSHLVSSVNCGICQRISESHRLGLMGSLGVLEGQHGKLPATVGCQDGSWNAACDARPARWLHGRNSAWLLFGFCSGLASSSATAATPLHANNLALAEALPSAEVEIKRQKKSVTYHGKPVIKNYNVTGIPGDGRCLFRAVAHGACLRRGKPAPTEVAQRELADELRNKVVDELIDRRSDTEWFIEEDFDAYTRKMRKPHVWGGEPELLMLTHVLKMPITVYMFENNAKGLIPIAEYGQEYGKERPVRVLYHGFGHYEALHFPGDI